MQRVSGLPDISIRQLEYLVAVANAPTWAAASERVGVSPSALSQGLAELERRVGVELFQAEGRRRVLRPSAQPVLDHARQVVSLTSDLTSWAGRVRSASSGRVRLGMIDVAAVDHYPDVLRAFRRERPDVALTLSVAPSADLLDDLRSGNLDVVVCVEPPADAPGIEVAPLRTEPIVVYAPAGTDVGDPPTWGPWVLFPAGSHTRHQIVDHLRGRGAPLHVAAESHQASVLREMVGLGLGWTVLPAASESDDDLVRGPVLFDRTLVVARRSGSVSDPAADELADRLRATRRSCRRDRQDDTSPPVVADEVEGPAADRSIRVSGSSGSGISTCIVMPSVIGEVSGEMIVRGDRHDGRPGSR